LSTYLCHLLASGRWLPLPQPASLTNLKEFVSDAG